TRPERWSLAASLTAALASVGATVYAHGVLRDRSLQQATARASSLASTTAESPLLRTPASPAVTYWIGAQLRSLELADGSIKSARLVGPGGRTLARVDHGLLVSPSAGAPIPAHDHVVSASTPGGERLEPFLARRAASPCIAQLPERLDRADRVLGA